MKCIYCIILLYWCCFSYGSEPKKLSTDPKQGTSLFYTIKMITAFNKHRLCIEEITPDRQEALPELYDRMNKSNPTFRYQNYYVYLAKHHNLPSCVKMKQIQLAVVYNIKKKYVVHKDTEKNKYFSRLSPIMEAVQDDEGVDLHNMS